MRWSSISKVLLFILSLALLLGQTVTASVYGVVGNEEESVSEESATMGGIPTYQPPNYVSGQTPAVSPCPEGSFVTGVLLGWGQKDFTEIDQCYRDGDNKYSCGFLWLDECKACTIGHTITKFHLFIKKVICSDGSQRAGVPLVSSGNDELLSCGPDTFVTGIEAIATSTDVARYGAFLGMRLYCAHRSRIQPGRFQEFVTESFGVHGLDWEEEMRDYTWQGKTITAPDFVCEDDCQGEYGWASGDEPDSGTATFPIFTKRQRQNCPIGYALQTILHQYNGPSVYEFGGGICKRVAPESSDLFSSNPFSEENMEEMRREAAERAAKNLPFDALDFEEDGSNDDGAEEGDGNGEEEPEAEEPEEEAEAESESEPCPPSYERNAQGICRPSSREQSDEASSNGDPEDRSPEEDASEEDEGENPPAQGSLILPLATTAAAGAAWGWYGCSLQASATSSFSLLSFGFILIPGLFLLIWRFRKRLFIRFD